MNDRINDRITDQMKLVGISYYPFTMDELKRSFRARILCYHPDKYKGRDAEEMTASIISAYNDLKLYANDFDTTKHKKSVETDIFKFYKGCDSCDGRGYNIKKQLMYKCSKCKDTGNYGVRCVKCDDGKFTQKNGRVVNCRACGGTGIYKLKCDHRLSFFQFSGYDYIDKRVDCVVCGGVGEVEYVPVNPVIPKGSIL
jgi:DnaJ-class molecular chaperone